MSNYKNSKSLPSASDFWAKVQENVWTQKTVNKFMGHINGRKNVYGIFVPNVGFFYTCMVFCIFYEDTLQNSWQFLSGSSSVTCNWTLPWKLCWNMRRISIMIKQIISVILHLRAGWSNIYISTKVYVADREWVLSYFEVTTTNCSERMLYNHLFTFTISVQLAFYVVFCSIY